MELNNQESVGNIKFYILIPTYERVELAMRAINSVLAQSYKNYQIILCNDGSRQDYSSVKNQNLIYLENNPNLGLNKTINKMFDFVFNNYQFSKNDYLIILDDDDYLLENSLETISQEITRSNFVSWLCFNCHQQSKSRHTMGDYTEYKQYSYDEFRQDYLGDKCFVYQLDLLKDKKYPANLYRSGFEHIFYYQLKTKINIIPKTVKAIQYYEDGLSEKLYKTVSILDAIKHIYALPTNPFAYKVLRKALLPKEMIKAMISPQKYYALKKKLGFKQRHGKIS